MKAFLSKLLLLSIMLGSSGLYFSAPSAKAVSCSPDRFESNNQVIEATNLVGDQSLEVSLCAEDQDVYQMDLDAGEVLHLDLTHALGYGMVSATFYGPSTSEDMYENRIDLEQKSDGTYAYEGLIREGGSYWLFVTGINYYSDTGVYDLNVSVEENINCEDEFESNDTMATASVLSENVNLNGAVCGYDFDYFSINLSESDEMELDLEYNENRPAVKMLVYGPDGSPMQEDSEQSDYASTRIKAEQSGTYTLFLYAESGDSFGNTYNLDVELNRSQGEQPETGEENQEFYHNVNAWLEAVQDFVATVASLQNTGVLSENNDALLQGMLESLRETTPGEETVEHMMDLEETLTALSATFEGILEAYASGSITADEFNAQIAAAFEAAREKLEERIAEIQADEPGLPTDLSWTEWYAIYAARAIENGYFTGYADGYMRADSEVSRIQLVKVFSELAKDLNRGVGAYDCDQASVEVSDEVWSWLGEDHWGGGYMQCAVNYFDEMGEEPTFTNIMSDGLAGANDEGAPRWEVILMLFELLDLEAGEYSSYTLTDMADASYPDEVKNDIEAAIQMGIIDGYPQDNTFRGFNSVLRAEMFKIVIEAYDALS